MNQPSTSDEGHVWFLDARGGRAHAVPAAQAGGDSQGYLDAVCTRVLTTANSTRLDSTEGVTRCPLCLSSVDEKVGERASWAWWPAGPSSG
ncbi:hypothetical protein [Goodfellowiella coeruleoviolacea]|uniref:Uncharacterized protein n=1 Tax=Goodfellowiella coeruleoviolacea TaxID=334858 RepID=A0AAE3GA98_9PSEU|nr:hypothetical protein [Goodfellowiella coeruleoviolacea]MCP2164567.1 hypothetical protein [Goodfellowiella coeruleoviolacea]